MGRMIEFIFQKVYLAMLASGIFLLLSFCGGVIFGVAPAGAVLMSLYAEHGSNYKAYHFQQAWNLFKDNFIQANQVFYSIAVVEALFIYGVYKPCEPDFCLGFATGLFGLFKTSGTF